jgi:hypothetical protein
VLESIKRAIDQGAFAEYDACPFDLETIEIYLQILFPAYELSIAFQKQDSTISDTLPALYRLIYTWETMIVSEFYQPFIKELVESIKLYFSYEMNLPIYKVNFYTHTFDIFKLD